METTDLGYPVISSDLYKKVFGNGKRPEMNGAQKKKAMDLLGEFNISVPVAYPENLFNGSLPLPDLQADNIKEHFETIAKKQVGHYKELGDYFSKCELPPIPSIDELIFEPGWVRYEWNDGWNIEHVEFPLEKIFTFDTETFVEGGALPIIGTALSDKAAYIWIAKELIDPSIPKEEWDQFDLIPIGTGKFVIGHNISYDRVRAQEGYSLENTRPENFYFDTLSAHIGVAGLASGQRWLYTLATKDRKLLTNKEKRQIHNAPMWLSKGSTNSMVQVYNHHVCGAGSFFGESEFTPLETTDKEVRDLFVKATELIHITPYLREAVDYAIKDALYTARIFQALWPKYLTCTPSMVALCGHYYLNGSVVPLESNWDDWINDTEAVYHSYNDEMTAICKELLWKFYEEWKSFESDPERKAWVREDPWLKQLDWEVKTEKGKYAGVPQWVRPFIKDPEAPVGVKSRLAHLLLKLTWEGQPLVWEEGYGWCYFVAGDSNFNREEWDIIKTEADKKLFGKKVPHPKGTGENVGSLFSKDFVEDMAVGRLSSVLPEAKRALEIADATSYWTSVRKRVRGRIFSSAKNPHGEKAVVTLPEILCHGTVTRRTVEPLFATMCKTKNWRIGTELKTRVKAPDGWKIVGADFDGQEMQIASVYSDKWEGGFVGCSPFGHNVLSGSKEAGTDPHSALAKIGGVDRELAKVVGFSILYGAALRAVMTYIRRKYPDKSENEVHTFAKRMIDGKKGVLVEGIYRGGTDSGCFNYMEKIALRNEVSTLPCLGTKISTAMRKDFVGKEFKTGRVNWTIQSSGAEILSVILTAVHWLADEYKIPCRFVISIHDEVWFITPEKYAEQFAVVFQIAHLYTWALFQYSVGIPDLPLSRAFFSSVAIDYRIRKTPEEKTVSPSNPNGINEPNGVEHSMSQLFDIGAVNKLKLRYDSIKKGLI